MIIAVLCGAVVGLALGLTGGGGSIFAVPLLIYGMQLEPRAATTVSLAAVGLIALAGAIASARTGLVELRSALLLAVTGMAAAPLGVTLAGHAPEKAIIGGFALLMLMVAGRMWTHAGSRPAETRAVRARPGVTGPVEAGPVCRYSADGQLHLNAPCSAALAGCGLVVGALSGFFGVGGGFLIVPALLAITQMGIHRAVTTSLLVIALVGAAGVAASWWQGRDVVWALAMLFALGGLAGMSLGRVLAARLAGPALQRLFALSMAVVAALMLSGQLDYF